MNKTLILMIVAVVVIGSVGAVFLLKRDFSRNFPVIQNRNIPVQPTSATPINSRNTPPSGVLPPKTTTAPLAGTDQTVAKKQATSLINQTNGSADEFNTMNSSASQLDQNTSL